MNKREGGLYKDGKLVERTKTAEKLEQKPEQKPEQKKGKKS